MDLPKLRAVDLMLALCCHSQRLPKSVQAKAPERKRVTNMTTKSVWTRQRPRLALSAIAVLLLASGSRMFAADSKYARETLRGINSVSVLVEDLDADEVRDGLTKDQIQTDVELRLRKAGINVVPQGSPTLYIDANLLKDTNLYIYDCSVALEQFVTVETNGVSTIAPTWSGATTGRVGSSNMPRAIRNTVGDLVDKSLNAYLSVNPPKMTD